MADYFSRQYTALSDPARRHYIVTPSDSEDLSPRPRALKCLIGGDVAIRDEAGTDITYPVQAGDKLEIRAVRVLLTGTTASVVAWE